MNVTDLLRYNIDFTHSITKAYVGDVTDEEMLARAVPGSNHIAWQLGHLIAAEKSLFEAVGADMPALPDGFAETHGESAEARASDEGFLTRSEYLELMDTMHEAAKAAIDKLDEADLDEPGPEKLRGIFPTVGAVVFMGGAHEMMHAGQIAAIRRKLNKPIVI